MRVHGLLTLSVLFSCVASLSATAPAAAVPLASDNSSITFVGTNAVTSQSGRFTRMSGQLSLSAEGVDRSSVRVTIDMLSVATAADGLTAHLKSRDFFDVERFPSATFVSTSIRPASAAGATHLVSGVLELKGVKRDIEFPIAIDLGQGRIKVLAQLTIPRRAFNVGFNGFMDRLIRDEVIVSLRIDAERPAGGAF